MWNKDISGAIYCYLPTKGGEDARKGVALVMVIFVIMILMFLGLNLSYSTRFGLLATKNLKDETAYRYAMISALNEALAYIAQDKDPTIDYMDEKGLLHLDDREPFPQEKEINGIRLKIELSDEESRLNINLINALQLRNLLRYADVPEEKIQMIIDSLRDWIDPDDLHRPSGAEKDYYEPSGYTAKNRPFTVPEELLLIRGFKKEYLYGSEKNKGIREFITTFGSGRLNINTAKKEVMEALGLGTSDIETILSQRSSLRGFRAVPPPVSGIFWGLSSNTFRIEIKPLDSYKRLTAIVQRIPEKKGYSIKTLYWKEEDETL